jgi:hypothetical protein
MKKHERKYGNALGAKIKQIEDLSAKYSFVSFLTMDINF